MKTRIITAIVAIIIFIVIIYFMPPFVAVAAFSLLCGIAGYELLGATGALKGHPLLWFSSAFAAGVPVLTAYGPEKSVLAAVYLYLCVSFVWAIVDHKRLGFSEVAEGFLGAFAVPYLLSAIIRILLHCDMGRQLILMPIIAAWCSDTMAYITGRLCGKHKLAPEVSPKKTVEGAVGGLLGGTAGMLIFGWIMQRYFAAQPQYALLAAAGAVGAAVGQFGDLAMSLIKRNCGIKDYGNLLPGHGGVLDRFDSVLFTAPFFEILLTFTGIL